MDYDMTKEEAIEFLKQVKYALLHSNSWLSSTHNPIEQSFDMAIEALQHQRQGVWITKDDKYYYCSICNAPHTDNYNFCHGCGAYIGGKVDV